MTKKGARAFRTTEVVPYPLSEPPRLCGLRLGLHNLRLYNRGGFCLITFAIHFFIR
jgi:hypothetical protein